VKNTEILKQELFEKYNIKTDRDLIEQLGIKEEDKDKLFAWITYQCAHSYNEGFIKGEEEFKEELVELLTQRVVDFLMKGWKNK
jgi:hypothetical protein